MREDNCCGLNGQILNMRGVYRGIPWLSMLQKMEMVIEKLLFIYESMLCVCKDFGPGHGDRPSNRPMALNKTKLYKTDDASTR